MHVVWPRIQNSHSYRRSKKRGVVYSLSGKSLLKARSSRNDASESPYLINYGDWEGRSKI